MPPPARPAAASYTRRGTTARCSCWVLPLLGAALVVCCAHPADAKKAARHGSRKRRSSGAALLPPSSRVSLDAYALGDPASWTAEADIPALGPLEPVAWPPAAAAMGGGEEAAARPAGLLGRRMKRDGHLRFKGALSRTANPCWRPVGGPHHLVSKLNVM